METGKPNFPTKPFFYALIYELRIQEVYLQPNFETQNINCSHKIDTNKFRN